jgi:hypothetical protein
MFGTNDSTTRFEDEEKVVPDPRRSGEDVDYVASTDAGHEAGPASEDGRPAEVDRARGTVYGAGSLQAGDTPAPVPTDGTPVAPVAVAPVDAVAPDETVDRTDYHTDEETADDPEGPDSTDAVYEESAAVDEEAPAEEEAPPADLKPGEADSQQPVTKFFADSDAEEIRSRWRELQLGFIDDPQSVAQGAQQLVDEAVANITAALNEAKDGLGNWREGTGDDTERLRAAVRSYRDFLDRVLGL